MFVAPAFRIEDEADLCAFIRARRFATLVVAGPEGPEAAHLPMLLVESAHGASLEGHLRRAHPVGALLATGAPALAIFHGGDAYVTPSLYPSKREHGKVVPTWNYVAVEVRGRAETFSDAVTLRAHVEQVTEMMEAGAATPWAVADAPEDYLHKMLAGIIGVRLSITAIEGVRKLSQNRPEPDRVSVETGFRTSPDPVAQHLADVMAHMAATSISSKSGTN